MVDWAHSDVFMIPSVKTLEEIVTQLCDPSSAAANVCTLPANFTHTHTHTRMCPPMCMVGVFVHLTRASDYTVE